MYLGRKPGYVKKGEEFDYEGPKGKFMQEIGPSPAPPPKLTAAEKKAAKEAAAKAEKEGKNNGGAAQPPSAPGGAPGPAGSGDKDVLG
jgi:hypothetical protein